ncbi:hypothetical protein [Sphingomonas corticis]|jgi:alkylhydroperoxidase family enzyme|uniref:Uncharacterized protein n=1 Tax=Sphingomonas corticis TaxID=2722791 RepID=A0ABX1CM58_9SPHN|nr:hypothetical protein [Sphingomonas corticis]NJR78504.1 hypothetical protein [Sphingomonas corticis]
MAYVDFSDDLLLAPAPSTAAPRSFEPSVDSEADARLSALEWSVVALARRDRLSSLSRPGRMSIALGKVFGTRRHAPQLADQRLEALRRMAVLTWHRGFAVPASELRAFFSAGFSAGQYETMTASIVTARLRKGLPA